MDKLTLDAIESAVFKALGAQVEKGRYLDMSRIPLICQNITTMHDDISEMKTIMQDKLVTQDQFWPVKTFVYGIVSIMLVAIVGAMINLVIKS